MPSLQAASKVRWIDIIHCMLGLISCKFDDNKVVPLNILPSSSHHEAGSHVAPIAGGEHEQFYPYPPTSPTITDPDSGLHTFESCSSSSSTGIPLSLNIPSCAAVPCVLAPNTPTTLELHYLPTHPLSDAKLIITALTPGAEHALVADSMSDVCNYQSCPANEAKVTELQYALTVPGFLADAAWRMEVKVVDEGEDVVCLRVPMGVGSSGKGVTKAPEGDHHGSIFASQHQDGDVEKWSAPIGAKQEKLHVEIGIEI